MIFLKKDRKPVGQNKQSDKKPQKHDANVQKNTTLYFQIGLILCLLCSYTLLEMQSEHKLDLVETYKPIIDPVFYEDPVVFKPEEITKKEVIKTQKSIYSIKPDEPILDDDDVLEDVLDDLIEENTVNVDDIVVVEPPSEDDNIVLPFHNIQNAPIYPGCEKFSEEQDRKQCFSDKIGKLVSRKYNKDVLTDSGLNGRQRVNVQFKIDKEGNVGNIKARAADVRMEKEAIKVIERLPKMTPGRQNDKNVEVIYNLPIILQVRQ